MTAMTAVASAFLITGATLASAANAANLNNDEYKYQLLLSTDQAVKVTAGTQRLAAQIQSPQKQGQQTVGDGIGTITNLLSGARTLAGFYKDCEASKKSFPECLIDGGPSLSDIQAQITQLSNQIAAFQKEFEADFSQLQASIDAVSAQMSKETGQAIDTELKPALQAADAAMGNYNAFAACQLKFYSQSTDQCTYTDSGGDGTLSGPANQATLDAIRTEIFTGLDMNPTSNSQDQVRGDGRMLDPNVFMQLMGGQVTNPWNCATSAASAANLVKSCGIMGNFFGNQVAGERSALGLPIDGKLTVFRPTFVNSMNSASVQMASIIGNYLVVRYGAATLMAQTLTPDSQQAGWISDLQSELTTLAKSGKASVTQPVLSPQQVVTTYSAPASAFPGSNDPGYQLNDNWSYFVGDTTGGLTIESYAVNAGAPSTTPGTNGGQLPTSAQAATVAADMGAVGQKWSAVSTAALTKAGLSLYPAATGDNGTNPAATGRLWTAPEKVYHDVINAEWSDVWGSYFWNARLNTPGYNNQVTSGTSIPQAYVPFYTRDALGIAGQTTVASEPLLYNVFDQTQSQSAPVASIQICQNASDPMCNLKSTAWSGFGHPYEDVWLGSYCEFMSWWRPQGYNCSINRQPVGSGNIVVVAGMPGIPPAVNWKVSTQPLGGILRKPADQNASTK